MPGPHLANNLLNLGITEAAREALRRLGYDLDEILAQEEEPGLGNGGLGRLASCYMDSLASVEVPAVGYGIRYEFGIFDQVIRNGWQQEVTDKWLRNGNPWEIPRSEIAYAVKFGGHTEAWTDEKARYRVRWIPDTEVKGVAYDTPIVGYRVDTCNILRLWKAEAVESFDFTAFNLGNYDRAGRGKGGVRDDHQGALSERRGAPRQGAPTEAAILFHELFAPRHAACPCAARQHARQLP